MFSMQACNRLLTVILVQVDPTGGRILIDGIDIATIGTHDLRSRLVGDSRLMTCPHADHCIDIYSPSSLNWIATAEDDR